MVRAIDLQTSILQTTQLDKIQQIQQHHADMQQKYMQLRLSEEDRLAREKVNKFKEADKAIIRSKEEGEERKRGEHQQQNPSEVPTDEKDESSEEGGHINITV